VGSDGLPLDHFEGVPLRLELHLLLPAGTEEGVLERPRPLPRDLPRSPRSLQIGQRPLTCFQVSDHSQGVGGGGGYKVHPASPHRLPRLSKAYGHCFVL